MNIINVLLGGLCAIFGTSQPPKDEGIELLKQQLESYSRVSDRERLAGDWRTVRSDMNKAWQRIKAEYGQS